MGGRALRGRIDAGRSPADLHSDHVSGSRETFRATVRESLEGGLVRYSKRRELLRLAGELGLSTFEANVLIAEVQYHQPDKGPFGASSTRWRFGRRRWIAAVIAIMLTVMACALAVR